MKFQIFPQTTEEWKRLHSRLSLWVIFVGGCIGLFWLWYPVYTGTVEVGGRETLRLLDALAFPAWVALLVFAVHFAQHVHTRQLPAKDYFPDRFLLDYLARRGMVYFLIAATVVAGISGVWEGADVTSVTIGSMVMLLAALMVNGIITALLLFKQWSDRWFEKVFPKRS